MQVGIVGAGLQGFRRAQGLGGTGRHRLLVVADPDFNAAQRLASTFKCKVTRRWQEVVGDPDVEALIVCTPPDVHPVIAIAALRAGKHVLCEKPLASSLEEAWQIWEVAQKEGRLLKCGFNLRHHPGIQLARKWFETGRIGAPIFVRIRYGIGGRPGYESEWRANPEISGGGHLVDQGIHALDLARWFLGDFSEVAAFMGTQFWNMAPLEDNAFVLLRGANQTTATIHSSLTQWKNLFSFELYGRDGYIGVEGLGGSYGTEQAVFGRRDFVAPFDEEIVEFRGEDRSWHEEWEEFVTSLEESREPLGSCRDGFEALRLVYAAYKSAKSGLRVHLSGNAAE
jgi:predicted dehydrogenase